MTGGTFYYDWMMVVGGIFLPSRIPEHGKTWLKPWDFKIVKESAGEVTVSMSLKDDFAYSAAPRQFRPGSTGIEAATTITLKADRAVLDTRVVLNESAGQGDRLRILDLHDARAGIGPKTSRSRPAAPKSLRRSGLTPRPAGRPIWPKATRA